MLTDEDWERIQWNKSARADIKKIEILTVGEAYEATV